MIAMELGIIYRGVRDTDWLTAFSVPVIFLHLVGVALCSPQDNTLFVP
jgi:hypothetical protein